MARQVAAVCCALCCVALAAGIFGCGGDDSPPQGPLAPTPGTGPSPAPAPEPAPAPFPQTTHGYFDGLSARPDMIASYSLRDPGQILQYSRGVGQRTPAITYDFGGDPDPRRQDAAKVTIPADKVSIPTHFRVPIPPVGDASLLVTWDAWWGKEFAHANTDIGNYKAFQFASPTDRIWTEIKSDFDEAVRFPPAVAMVTARTYGSPGETLGPNVLDKNPLSPQAAPFAIMPETWTRYWAWFNPVGQWHEFSLWVADEGRDAVLVLDRLQLKPNTPRGAQGWESFWLEYDTSATKIPETRGPLVAYVRNIVMLRGVSSVRPLMQRPAR